MDAGFLSHDRAITKDAGDNKPQPASQPQRTFLKACWLAPKRFIPPIRQCGDNLLACVP
jgi:hypothetical protein